MRSCTTSTPLRLSSVVLFALVGCGSSTAPSAVPTTAAPLSEEERVLFDDGVDFVGDPSVLEGRWRDDWSRELDARVTGADVIAVVRVATLRTDTDLQRLTTFRLILDVLNETVGELDEDPSIASTEGDGGFVTIEGNERRVLDQEFVLFLKWEQASPTAPVRARWHLSPHTDDVLSRVEYLAERRRGVRRDQPNRTVHVHEAE